MTELDTLRQERREASARLHDHVGQLLTASLINIEVGWPGSTGEAGLREEVIRDLRDALTHVRDVSVALGQEPPGIE